MSWRGAARRSLPYLITATAGFALAYLLAALVLFPTGLVPSDVKVPAVVGLPLADAQAKLVEAGFRVTTGEKRYHASTPAGIVLGQAPVAGSVEAKGASVALDVSLGQRAAAVPSLVGLSRQRAELALDGVGLALGEVTEQTSDAARGEVLSSAPAAGASVPVGTEVTLVVSSGPGEVSVPDLTGSTLAQARALLDQVGLKVGTVTNDSLSSMPPNTIIAQSPAAGRTLAPGSRVALTVAGSAP